LNEDVFSTGRDMVQADQLAGPKAGQLTIQIALLSRNFAAQRPLTPNP